MVKQRETEIISSHVTVCYDKIFPLYVVTGNHNFLIDSGAVAGVEDFKRRIAAVLENLPPAKEKTIHTLLLTHTHWDHAGSAFELQKIFPFRVMTSQRGAELLQKNKVIEFINRLNQDYKKMNEIEAETRFDLLQNLEGLKEGDRIPVDDESYFEVFETPGHTKCSISYFLLPERTLFTGDSTGVSEQAGDIKPLFLSSYTEYVASIRRFMNLEIEMICFPHNKWIKGKEKIKSYLEHSLARTEYIKDKIQEYLRQKMDTAIMAETICRDEFPKPTLFSPPEAVRINIEAMINTVQNELPGL